MAKSADTIRRWLGGVFLGVAVLMLILGQTLLANSLQESKKVFLFYWLGCFAFTGLAALVAILDFVLLRRRVRLQKLEFLENTLREIAEQQDKSRETENR